MHFSALLTDCLRLYKRHWRVFLSLVVLLAVAGYLTKMIGNGVGSYFSSPPFGTPNDDPLYSASGQGVVLLLGLVSAAVGIVLAGPVYYALWLVSLDIVAGRRDPNQPVRLAPDPERRFGPFLRLIAVGSLAAWSASTLYSWLVSKTMIRFMEAFTSSQYPASSRYAVQTMIVIQIVFQVAIFAWLETPWVLAPSGVLMGRWRVAEAISRSWRWTRGRGMGALYMLLMLTTLWSATPLTMRFLIPRLPGSSALERIRLAISHVEPYPLRWLLTQLDAFGNWLGSGLWAGLPIPLVCLAGAFYWRAYEAGELDRRPILAAGEAGPRAPST